VSVVSISRNYFSERDGEIEIRVPNGFVSPPMVAILTLGLASAKTRHSDLVGRSQKDRKGICDLVLWVVTSRYDLHKHAKQTLGTGNYKQAVQLPHKEGSNKTKNL
jgi:hypothetical protein